MDRAVRSESPPGAGDLGQILIGQLSDELAEPVEGGDRNGVMHDPDVARNPFLGLVALELRADPHAGGLDLLDGIPKLGQDLVGGPGSLVEQAQRLGAIGISGGDSKTDKGDLRVDLQSDLASDGKKWLFVHVISKLTRPRRYPAAAESTSS